MQAPQLSKIDLLMAIVFKILYKIQHSNIPAILCSIANWELFWMACFFVLQFSFFFYKCSSCFSVLELSTKNYGDRLGSPFLAGLSQKPNEKKNILTKNRYSLELIIACTQLRFPYIIRTFMYKGARVFFSCCVRWAYPLVGSHFFSVSRDWGKWAISYS